MAAPLLRRYSGAPSAINTWTPVMSAVPTGRAMVVSKVIVTNGNATAISIYLGVGAAGNLAANIVIPAQSVYTETGFILLTGETVQVYSSSITMSVAVFGEEVDN